MKEKLICALLFGEAEAEKTAKHIARCYEDCPYVSLMATKGRQLFATFFLPRRQIWWIEYVEKKPRTTFRLKKAKVTIVDDVQYPKELKMRLAKKPQNSSPCGATAQHAPLIKDASVAQPQHSTNIHNETKFLKKMEIAGDIVIV